MNESTMPERDALWAKHSGITPALAAELLVFSGTLEQSRNVWRHSATVAAAELESEQEKSLGWFIEFQALKNAVDETLQDNRHLADGDVCTLKKLKDAYAKAMHAGHDCRAGAA